MKYIVLLIIHCCSFLVYSQQEPQSSQFMINPFIVNPAYSSVEDLAHFQLGYRKQWEGIDNTPSTSYLSFHAPINKPRWARTHPGDFHDWHGTGGVIIRDNIGAFNFTRIQANYSYNLGLSKGEDYGYYHVDGLRISFGANLGIDSYGVDKDALS